MNACDVMNSVFIVNNEQWVVCIISPQIRQSHGYVATSETQFLDANLKFKLG